MGKIRLCCELGFMLTVKFKLRRVHNVKSPMVNESALQILGDYYGGPGGTAGALSVIDRITEARHEPLGVDVPVKAKRFLLTECSCK